jgi:hypothetical protein
MVELPRRGRGNPRTETKEQCRACSPPRFPEVPVHARALLGLRGLGGALLLQGETPVFGVRLLIARGPYLLVAPIC